MQNLTHLGRPIDLRFASNRFAAGASLALGLIAFLTASGGTTDRLLAAGVVALAGFLSWALGRELDPDRPLTANLATVAGGAMALAFEGTGLGPLFLLLVAARVLAGTTGLAPTLPDLVFLVVVAALLARTPSGWVGGIALAFALARDVSLPDPAPPRQLLWAGATALGVAVVAGIQSSLGAWTAPTPTQWAVVAAGLIGAVLVVRPEPVASHADLTLAPLSDQRLLWARGTVVAGLVLATLVAGGFAVSSVAPAWATVAVTGAVRMGRPRPA